MNSASLGGLEFEALRNELEAARKERALLMEQAAKLELHAMASSLPLGSSQCSDAAERDNSPLGNGFEGFISSVPAVPIVAGPRRLSWGSQRPTSAAATPPRPPVQSSPSVTPSSATHHGPAHTPSKSAPSPALPPSAAASVAAAAAAAAAAIANSWRSPPYKLLRDSSPAHAGIVTSSPAADAADSPSQAKEDVQRSSVAVQGKSFSDALADAFDLKPHGAAAIEASNQAKGAAVACNGRLTQQQASPDRDGPIGSRGTWLSSNSEEAVRRQVLREVLGVMLDISGPKLDNYQLDVQSVASVIRERNKQAVSDARLEGEQAAKAARDKAEKALKEAAQQAGVELAKLKQQAEEERSKLQSQVSKLKQDVDALGKEKKKLVARASQQNQDTKKTSEVLQASQEKVSSLEKQVERSSRQCSKLQADMERCKSECEARVQEVEQQASKQMTKAEGINAKLKQQLQESQAQREQQSQAVKAALEAELTGARHQLVAAGQHAKAAEQEAAGQLAELQDLVLQVMQSTQQQLQECTNSMAECKASTLAAVKSLHHEVPELRQHAADTATSFTTTLHSAVQSYQQQVDRLLAMDSQLRSLGPGGLDGLCSELHQRRSQMAQLELMRDSLQQELQHSEAARRKLALEKQLADTEIQMLASSETDMKKELTARASQNSTLQASLAELQAKLAAAQAAVSDQSKQVVQLRSQLVDASQKMEQVLARCEVAETKATELESKMQRDKAQAERDAAAALQQAAEAVAGMVRGLRLKYFTAAVGSQQEQAGLARGGPAADGPMGKPPVPRPGASLVQCHEPEDVVGLRLCTLSHDDIMGALESYVQRQAEAAAEAQWEAQGMGLQGDGSRSYSEGTAAPKEAKALDAGNAVGKSVGRELLWLEGCLLLVLVDLRSSKGREGQEARQQGPGADEQTQASSSAWGSRPSTAHSSSSSGGATQSLVTQMMRAMAREKRELQRKLSSMSQVPAGDSAVPADLAATYLSLRRSQSARSSDTFTARALASLQPTPQHRRASDPADSSAIPPAAPPAAGVIHKAAILPATSTHQHQAQPALHRQPSQSNRLGSQEQQQQQPRPAGLPGPGLGSNRASIKSAPSGVVSSSSSPHEGAPLQGMRQPPASHDHGRCRTGWLRDSASTEERAAAGAAGVHAGVQDAAVSRSMLLGASVSRPAASFSTSSSSNNNNSHNSPASVAVHQPHNGYDVEEVMEILHALEHSGLRSSRGMTGMQLGGALTRDPSTLARAGAYGGGAKGGRPASGSLGKGWTDASRGASPGARLKGLFGGAASGAAEDGGHLQSDCKGAGQGDGSGAAGSKASPYIAKQ